MQVITPLFNLEGFPENARALTPCTFQGETVGAFFLAPQRAITGVYGSVLRALGRGRVLLLYIDGLGYSLYERACFSSLPFIRRTFACTAARTAYPCSRASGRMNTACSPAATTGRACPR